MNLTPELNNYIAEHDNYHPTNLYYHKQPTMSILDKLWVKHDDNGYHYRTYYRVWNQPELHQRQIYTNLANPLNKGDVIGTAKIL